MNHVNSPHTICRLKLTTHYTHSVGGINMITDYYLGLSEEGFHHIVYTEWGTSSSRYAPLISIHGLTRNRRDFDNLASYLSQREFHLVCPDMVGRGDSDWLKNPLYYTYEQYIADCNVLISRIER